MQRLKQELSKYGTLVVAKEGLVLSIMITGKGLSNITTVLRIQEAVIEYADTKYPLIEVAVNTEEFFLMILKPDFKVHEQSENNKR